MKKITLRFSTTDAVASALVDAYILGAEEQSDWFDKLDRIIRDETLTIDFFENGRYEIVR